MKNIEIQISNKKMPFRGWHALKWNYFGNVARGLSQFLIGILLARLLGPEPFGIVAIAWLILGIGNLISNLGFGAALVQRENISRLDLRFIFTCQLSASTLLTILGIISAESIAVFFHKPNATSVIQVMSCLFVIQSFGQTGTAVLQRSMDFKILQKITIISYLIGYIFVGIPAAYMGLGVWSIVAAQLLQSTLNSILLIRITAVPITPLFNGASPGVVTFGLKIIAANISSWCIGNLDSIFVGRAFGVTNLGLYNRAMNLVSSPMGMITTGFQGVLFSACSRTQSDPDKIKRIYLGTNAAVTIICFPIFISAAVIPETLILAIYGAKWQEAISLITPLSLAVLVHALLAITGPILMAMNKVEIELKNQIFTILISIPILLILSQYSLATITWGVLAIYLIRWILLTFSTLHYTGVTLAEFISTFYIPLIFSLGLATIVAIADNYLFFIPALYRLVAIGGITLIAALFFLRFFGRHFLNGHINSFVQVKNLPDALRKFLNV